MKPHEAATQKCFQQAEGDGQTALKCLKKVVAEYAGTDVCHPKLVLLVEHGCVPCKEEAALHTADIARGIVQKIFVDSPLGIEIIEKNHIEYTPSLLLLDCHDKIITPV